MGLGVAPQTPSREWRDLYGALDCAVAAAVHPFYVASVREFVAAGRPVVGSGPVGLEGTSAWLDAIGRTAGIAPEKIDAAKAQALPPIRAALEAHSLKARITVSGYEGSELLVARLLVEAGAEVPYVGTACPRTEWSDADRGMARGAWHHRAVPGRRSSRTSQQCAMSAPDLAIGTTPLVQQAKELGIPAIYFTNMVSARPLFGAAGIGALTGIVRTQTKGADRFSRMVSFFDGVGTGETAGYGTKGIPQGHPAAREKFRRAREAKARASEAMGS